MGYAATTIVLYGVELPEHIAKNIYEELTQDDDNFDEDCELKIKRNSQDIYYRKLGSYCLGRGRVQQTPITPYSQHGEGTTGCEVFHPNMISDGTDSRSDNLSFEPGYPHYFGIYVASKGYGADDTISYFSKNMPLEAIENFKKYIEPILVKHGIKDYPDLIIATQTW